MTFPDRIQAMIARLIWDSLTLAQQLEDAQEKIRQLTEQLHNAEGTKTVPQ